VTYFDWLEMRRRFGRSAAIPGSGAAPYTPFHDANGDGAITVADLLAVRRNLLKALPAAAPAPPPAAPAAAAPPPASTADELFGDAPLLSP
jgi:hypothetical protein